MLDARAEDALQVRVDLGEQASRLEMRAAPLIRSSSKPTIISSSAMVSSSSSTERSVCGMTRAASAMKGVAGVGFGLAGDPGGQITQRG